MNILCTICARGGSKGVPRKNIKELNGKPLIYYSINQALKWGKANKVVVSTDDEEIADIARYYGAEVPFLRPKELATDNAGKLDVIKHVVNYYENKGERFDIVVDLDPTSPLRSLNDLENALNLFLKNKPNNLYSVCEARKNPYFNMVELDEYNKSHISKKLDNDVLSRQTAPKVYEMNASIYIYNKNFLINTNTIHSDNTIVYIMSKERSIDIDSEIDFYFVEFLLEKGIVIID